MFSYKDKTEALQIAVTVGFITLEVAKEEMNKMLGREEKREPRDEIACGGVGFFMPPAQYHDDMLPFEETEDD